MRRLLLILSVCCPLSAHARQMTADAVILRNDATFTVTDKTHASYRHTIEFMVTEKGKRRAAFSCSVNNGSTKLKSFSGEIKDATGKVTKIKKSDNIPTAWLTATRHGTIPRTLSTIRRK